TGGASCWERVYFPVGSVLFKKKGFRQINSVENTRCGGVGAAERFFCRCGASDRPGARCVTFFQAEDGIRDWSVTGVQTCALPIYTFFFQAEDGIRDWSVTGVQTC